MGDLLRSGEIHTDRLIALNPHNCSGTYWSVVFQILHDHNRELLVILVLVNCHCCVSLLKILNTIFAGRETITGRIMVDMWNFSSSSPQSIHSKQDLSGCYTCVL